MNAATPLADNSELAAALLQAAITAALAGLCGFLFQRYRKPYLGWWSAAWTLYLLRLAAIISFVVTQQRAWLYWHQVVTGWTALAVLAAALVFSRGLRWRWSYLPLFLFPPLWSYVAIYRIDAFGWAAGPAVAFLSLATLWTGWVFLSYRRRVASSGAALLGGACLLWGLHHLDYPFLRARGAWTPWGYYLDVLFELAVGAGILLGILVAVVCLVILGMFGAILAELILWGLAGLRSACSSASAWPSSSSTWIRASRRSTTSSARCRRRSSVSFRRTSGSFSTKAPRARTPRRTACCARICCSHARTTG